MRRKKKEEIKKGKKTINNIRAIIMQSKYIFSNTFTLIDI